MGHQINMITVEKNVDRKSVELNANEEAMHEGWLEGSSGLDSKIIWREDLVFDSYKQAVKFVEKESNKTDYLQIAVLFKEAKETKTMKNKKAQADKAFKELEDLKKEDFFKNRKSKTVACPHCESKVNVTYVRYNKCPVCGTDLRSKSVKDRIENKRKKVNQLYDELEEMRKNTKNYTLKWLVKYEYHV